ncbi:hypothetical protein ADL07_26150 [Streptomyces sp. NRRL F-4707]|nr:hypothetical protein ADK87_26725 [Streptomyces sp. NRRL F-4711]KOX28862.1 hypothetical protein ADL07_26150 [Streptomyces sp. NRRL F-4707]KOX42606.1 hypothetical protein ADL09_29665 [Streptomyces sp. NRRL F-7442]
MLGNFLQDDPSLVRRHRAEDDDHTDRLVDDGVRDDRLLELPDLLLQPEDLVRVGIRARAGCRVRVGGGHGHLRASILTSPDASRHRAVRAGRATVSGPGAGYSPGARRTPGRTPVWSRWLPVDEIRTRLP